MRAYTAAVTLLFLGSLTSAQNLNEPQRTNLVPSIVSDAQIKIEQGSSAFREKDFAAAANAFKLAAETSPTLFGAFYNLGVTELELGRYGEAVQALKQATSLSPEAASAWRILGFAYDQAHQTANAIASYLKALAIEQSAVTNTNLALDYVTLRRYEEAGEGFRKALEINSNYRPAVEGACFISSTLERADAREYCYRAHTIDQNNWFTSFLLGVAYLNDGAAGEAAKVLDSALAGNPKEAQIHVARGFAYHQLGRTEEAIGSFHRAMKLNPSLAGAYDGLASVLFAGGKFQAAKESLNRAIELDPAPAKSHYNLAIICLALGQRGCALEQYGILKSLNPSLGAQLLNEISRDRIVKVGSHNEDH